MDRAWSQVKDHALHITNISKYSRKVYYMVKDQILLDHGSGGKMSHELITSIMLPVFQNKMVSSKRKNTSTDLKE